MVTTLIALTLFMLGICISPGPNNVLLIRSGTCFGYVKTLPHILGGIVGTLCLLWLCLLGLGVLIKQSPPVYMCLQVLSLVYLLWLTWQVWWAQPTQFDTHHFSDRHFAPLSLFQSFMLVFINPTAWMLVLGILSQYAAPSVNGLPVLLIQGVFIAVGLLCSSIWTLAGLTFKKWLIQPTYIRLFSRTTSVLLLLSLIPSALNLLHALNTLHG